MFQTLLYRLYDMVFFDKQQSVHAASWKKEYGDPSIKEDCEYLLRWVWGALGWGSNPYRTATNRIGQEYNGAEYQYR